MRNAGGTPGRLVGHIRRDRSHALLAATALLALAGCALASVGDRLAGRAMLPLGKGLAEASGQARILIDAPELLAAGPVRAGRGVVQVSVQWPGRYRTQVIPGTATGVLFGVRNGTALVASASVTRPAEGGTSTASLELDAGAYTLEATASAGTRAVAAASASLTVVSGSRTGASLTLAQVPIEYSAATLAGGSFADGPSSSARFSVVGGLAFDSAGNLFEADSFNNRIRKVAIDGTVTTLAGDGVTGFADGPGSSARFYRPVGICLDASGNVYVGDAWNYRVRKISPSGVVSTLAGDGTQGFADGPGASARFRHPVALAVDASGTVFVADNTNHRIRKIAQDGSVSTFAGDGTAGYLDGAGTSARFDGPVGIAVDASGSVYVAERGNRRIRKVATDGTVTTLAGDGSTGYADGAGSSAKFGTPVGLGLAATGFLYVADMTNNRVRGVSQTGVVTTVAGDGTAGFIDAATTSARFSAPKAIAVSPSGAVFVGESENRVIRRIATGMVTTAVGAWAFSDGSAGAALFGLPEGIALDAAGNVFVADMTNNRIRRIDTAGNVSTVAGEGSKGFSDGPALAAKFNVPSRIAVSATGEFFVSDQLNHRIRKISTSGLVTTVAGNGEAGFADGNGIAAKFNNPAGISVDASGTLFVADSGNHRIRRVTANGDVTTLAGDGTSGFQDGPGASARFASPVGIALDRTGTLVVAEWGNHKIRQVAPSGTVTTLAGQGTAGFADGSTTSAQFNSPRGVAIDAAGSVYVADTFNYRIRLITPAGQVSTIAGDGAQAYKDGIGPAARFALPTDVALDGNLNVLVVDRWNMAIRILR